MFYRLCLLFLSVCTLPENVANSDLLVSVDKFEALYSCHVGYTMLGGNARYCQQEGLGWLPDPPICGKQLIQFCFIANLS